AADPSTLIKVKDGELGTWTFEGWTSTDVGIDGAGSEFGMPAQHVEIIGTWSFTPNTRYNVTYTVTGEKPEPHNETFVTPQTHQHQMTVTVDGIPTTTATENGEGVLGTWTFSGWTTNDAEVSGGSFTMPNGNVDFTGYWIFNDNPSHEVIYQVTGDRPDPENNKPATPQMHQEEATVTVAADPTTTATDNGEGILGSWIFNGWTSDDVEIDGAGDTFVMPSGEVTITGTWSFTPNPSYWVEYEIKGATPEAVSDMPDPLKKEHQCDALVEVSAEPTSTATSNGDVLGIWTFDGWTSTDVEIEGAGDTFTMPDGDVKIIGTWTFTPNPTWTLSYEVTGTVPSPQNNMPDPLERTYQRDAIVTVADEPTTTATDNGSGVLGTWTFDGWTSDQVTTAGAKDTFAMPNTDVTITGSWTFTPNPSYKVTYTVTGTQVSPVSGLPSTPRSHQQGSIVMVQGDPTTTQSDDGESILGSWTFSGWTTEDATVSDGSFEMPNSPVKFTGYWIFTPNPYHDVTYRIDGPAPATISDMPTPLVKSVQKDAMVTVAGAPSTAEKKNDAELLGTWTFDGWQVNGAVESGGSFTMPDDDVTIIGTWSFTANPYFEVEYSIESSVPVSVSGMPDPLKKDYQRDAVVTVAGDPTTTSKSKGGILGTWTFEGWQVVGATESDGAFEMPDHDVKIVGAWSFDPNPSYSVTYTVTGDEPDVVEGIPVDSVHQRDALVEVADHPTTTSTHKDGKQGVWTFEGWTTEHTNVVDGSFEMPDGDVEFFGTWNFVADPTYVIVYAPGKYGTWTADSQTIEDLLAGSDTPLCTADLQVEHVEGWHFIGWTDGVNVYQIDEIPECVTCDMVYTALWEKDDEPIKKQVDPPTVAGKAIPAPIASVVSRLPKTGEDLGRLAMIAIPLIASIGIIIAVVAKRRSDEEEEVEV
ncbi:MAG: SHIRT domain-containing protein, partial [Coriobacteriia bacterium]|nr:SHIRT domain-containing protein [Coriobacteriia bacterium]